MNDMISKSEVLKWLEIQIADCSRELKRELFAEDLVTISESLDTLKKVYDNIKDMTPLQFTDSADKAEDYTKREIETAVKNNCLAIRLNVDTLKESKHWKCSNCNGLVETAHCCYNCYYKFCPNCGAEMKRGKENE